MCFSPLSPFVSGTHMTISVRLITLFYMISATSRVFTALRHVSGSTQEKTKYKHKTKQNHKHLSNAVVTTEIKLK